MQLSAVKQIPGARRAASALRRAWAGVRGRWLRDVFRPQYGGRGLAVQLAGYRGDGADALGSADGERVQAWLRDYLRARQAPRFLFDGTALHAEDSAQGKARDRWLSAACEQARELCRVGLSGYGRRAQPLAAGFPWGGNAETSADVMHVVRVHRFAFVPRLALAVIGGGYSARH